MPEKRRKRARNLKNGKTRIFCHKQSVCVCVCVYVCVCVCVCIYIYIYIMYVCMYVVYMYLCMYVQLASIIPIHFTGG